ncbi:Fur family transcriptional regulator [Nocardiopsis trehalosi]|jgi:Fur family ferric uptake transcriptional regulator|uniref:Fur family transcriptional regulator n=1 Tax=Nocardiopsis trehalosi TaxID=109329 RepID=UPI000829BF21|nr:transcriptional repressor [Nocardiopsis trehalosi]
MARYNGAVLAVLRRDPGFRSAQEVHDALTAAADGAGRVPSLSTVYRALRRLAGDGVLDTGHTADGERLYRLCATSARHHHLLCRSCGGVTEVTETRAAAELATRIGTAGGYTAVEYAFDLSGICPSCQDAPVRTPGAEDTAGDPVP